MSKTVSRDKDIRASGMTTSSRTKPSSSIQPQTTIQVRSDAKGTNSQTQGSLTSSKTTAEPVVSVPKTHPQQDIRANEWKHFFLESGIPEHAAMEYAGIFVKERINWPILKSLDKGYLTDMGINCIGDQISILQAAKKYCGEQYASGQSKPLAQPVTKMEVEEPRTESPRTVASSARVAEAPERVTVLSTVSRLSPKKSVVRNEVTSTTPVRSVIQNPRNPASSVVHLRGKRPADDEEERVVLKKVSNQPARQVRQLPVEETNFTVRLGSGASIKRGDVFSRLSQKGNKSTSNTNLVRVLESRMSRLSTGPSSAMPNNGVQKPTLVSDSMSGATPVFNRLGATHSLSRSLSSPQVRTSGSSVFDRLGYQTKSKTGSVASTGGDMRTNRTSVHDRLGTRR